MNITILLCRACNAPLRVMEDAKQVRCDYCGTDQAIARNRLPDPPQAVAALAPAISTRNQLTALL